MTTSRPNDIIAEIEDGLPVPAPKLAYFQQRTRNRLYNFVVERFREAARERGLTKAELARRLGKRPEVINRILAGPGNWTVDTVSDLLIGIEASELEPHSKPLLRRAARNYRGRFSPDVSRSSLTETRATLLSKSTEQQRSEGNIPFEFRVTS